MSDGRDRYGRTPLMVAAHDGDVDEVGRLVAAGVDLDVTAKYGLSAVMLAVLSGHAQVVDILVSAGADLDVRGTGAPGFAGRTALDLARERGEPRLVDLLTPGRGSRHFERPATWEAAARRLTFRPLRPADTGGYALQSLRVHVRDHRLRHLAPADRTLEAGYGGFTLSQACPGRDEARRRAVEVRYGADAMDLHVGTREGRAYAAGAPVPPDDPDGRMPAVVTWHDGDLHLLIASHDLPVTDLIRIAGSIHA